MLTQTSNFLDDATGIEKTLRLAQGLCTVLAGLAVTAAAAEPWATVKAQVNLSRRFLRLHKCHPCFSAAYRHSGRADATPLEKLLQTAKWSFLGLYFLLEAPTVTNAMGITSYDWGLRLQDEALKCWFYGIAWSIVLGYYQLAMLPSSRSDSSAAQKSEGGQVSSEKDGTAAAEGAAAAAAAAAAELSASRSAILTQLAIDHCDIFLPGSAVGWIPVGPVTVGTCQSISSVLAMPQIWRRVPAAA